VRVRETAQPVQREADNKGMLDHERLDVYHCALPFVALALQIRLPPPASSRRAGDGRTAKALWVRVVSMLTKLCR
jgi:hypothetical protein